MAGGSGQSMSSLAYYQPEHPGSAGVVKYPENGHDTLSDFVTFVCQEAENTQQLPQVASVSDDEMNSIIVDDTARWIMAYWF